jgi:hypothetical protein
MLVLGGQILIFCATALILGEGSCSGIFAQTYDFGYLYDGAKAWLEGHDPYHVNGFITPPVSLIIPALLAHLSLARATFVFFIGNLLLVPLAMWWYAGTLGIPRRERRMLLLASALFVSAQQSVRGGNLDGVMLVLLVAAFSTRRRFAGAFWLAASIGIKLYSVILVPVALRRRQWRFAALVVFAVLLMLLPFHNLWPSAVHALMGRSQREIQGSIAPATLIFLLTGGASRAGTLLAAAFWGITFAVTLYGDHEVECSPRTLARYVPWMLALPAMVFSYAGVLALTVLTSLAAVARKRPLQRAEQCMLAGFLLLGIHVERVTNVLPLTMDTDLFFRGHAAVIQSLGVVLMMIGTCASRCGETPEEDGAGDEIAGGKKRLLLSPRGSRVLHSVGR